MRYFLLYFLIFVTNLAAENLEIKIGQLFFGIVYGAPLTKASHEMLKESYLGNVILFNWCNTLENKEDALLLTQQIKETILENTGYAPWIAIDQEGGRVSRLKPPAFNEYLSPRDIALSGSLKRAFNQGLLMGDELASVGINVNLAPVIDVDSEDSKSFINNRSYSSDPRVVTAFSKQFLSGLHKKGILATLKHFPGHGSAISDPHLSLPLVKKTCAEMASSDLIPFIALKEEADFIMIGHLLIPAYDPCKPATLSPKIINDLLRKSIGYEGLILTDSLAMRGVAPNQANFEETVKSITNAAIEAFLAGADLLLLSKPEWADIKTTPEEDMQLIKGVILSFRQAVIDGVIPLERVNESIKRIQKVKGSKKQILASPSKTA